MSLDLVAAQTAIPFTQLRKSSCRCKVHGRNRKPVPAVPANVSDSSISLSDRERQALLVALKVLKGRSVGRRASSGPPLTYLCLPLLTSSCKSREHTVGTSQRLLPTSAQRWVELQEIPAPIRVNETAVWILAPYHVTLAARRWRSHNRSMHVEERKIRRLNTDESAHRGGGGGGGGDGGFSLASEDFGRMFDSSFPACALLLLLFLVSGDTL